MAKNWIVGHTDGYTDSSSDNGGGYDVDTFMTSSTQAQKFAALHDGDGGPVSASGTWGGLGAACTMEGNNLGEETAYVQINYANGFEDVEIGMIANCEFNGTTYTDDRYEVLASASGYVVINLPYTSAVTCDCNVGGFFDAFSAPFTLSAVGAGDEVHVVGGYTYTQTADVSISSGSAVGEIVIHVLDSSGDFLAIARNTSDCYLDDTDFPIINLGSSYQVDLPSGYLILVGLKFTGTTNDWLLDGYNSADYMTMYGVVVHNSGTGTSAKAIATGNRPSIRMCDFIVDSENISTYPNYPFYFETATLSYSTHKIDACIFKLNSGYGPTCSNNSGSVLIIENSVVWGNQSCDAAFIACRLLLSNCVVYDFPVGIRTWGVSTTYLEQNIADCIFEDVVDIITNTVTGGVRVDLFNNVFNGYTDIFDNTKSNFHNPIYVNNIENPTNSASEFNDADNGDFTLISSAEAIGIGVNGNSAGAFQPVATGGGGDTVVISKGMLGVMG